jgi:adenosylhomocysteine nucleosidase
MVGAGSESSANADERQSLMTLCIRCGMASEFQRAHFYAKPGTIVLDGVMTPDELDAKVPSDVTGILSFGLNGGLAPYVQAGDGFVYGSVVTPAAKPPPRFDSYSANAKWIEALAAATGFRVVSCWSSGEFNTGNDAAQRTALYSTTLCPVIDDESFSVAIFAEKRGIPFCGMRVASDGTASKLPPAVMDALRPDGSDNLWAVVKSVIDEPKDPATGGWQFEELLKVAADAKTSLDALDTACVRVGPAFKWEA